MHDLRTFIHIQQSSIFSLRPSSTTSSGGVSLLLPTPYTIKMALIDSFFRLNRKDPDKATFSRIRDLTIRIRPPLYLVISGSMFRILRPPHDSKAPEPFQSTMGYREYVQWSGFVTLAISPQIRDLNPLFYGINYLGKRGSFIQVMDIVENQTINDPYDFTCPYDAMKPGPSGWILQPMDDMGNELTLEHVSPYHTKRVKISEQERHIIPTRVPVRLVKSSGKFRFYTRTGSLN